MAIATLSIIAKIWKQLVHQQKGLINFGVFANAMLLSNKKECTYDTCNDMNKSQNITRRERSQNELKSPYCMIPFIESSKTGKTNL